MRHIEAGKDAAIEAEMQASRERAVIPLESRVQQFMEMLAEKEVLFLSFSVLPFSGRTDACIGRGISGR